MIQKTIIGVFADRMDAEEAISTLREDNYDPKDISIVMQNNEESNEFANSTGTNVVGGATTGATTGAVLGGIAGLLIGVGAIALPGVGALLIGGPLAAALGLSGAAATTLSGAATGALAGGLLGALLGLGVPEEDARVYAERVKAGGILIAIPARLGEEEDVRALLEDSGADTIRTLTLNTRSRQTSEAVDGSAEYNADEDDTIINTDYPASRSTHVTHTGSPAMSATGRKGGRSASSKTRTRKRILSK